MIFNNKKKIIFLTGTRADYGKLKPLIIAANKKKKISTNNINYRNAS